MWSVADICFVCLHETRVPISTCEMTDRLPYIVPFPIFIKLIFIIFFSVTDNKECIERYEPKKGSQIK